MLSILFINNVIRNVYIIVLKMYIRGRKSRDIYNINFNILRDFLTFLYFFLMPKFCDKKNSCILTYASTFAGTLKLEFIKRRIEEVINEKTWGITYYAIAKETADKEIKRDHYHVYLEFTDYVSFGYSYFDVLLYEPVYSFYENNNNDDVTATLTENYIIKKYGNCNTNT